MQQVLFRIPPWLPNGLPIYGYGLMLFLAFFACTWLAGRLARREGIAPEHVQDLTLFLFVGGLVGSRVVYMAQFGVPLWQFFFIWEGGLVFYGGLFGGTVAYALAHRLILRKHDIPPLRMADVIAPCLALGLGLGRVGCLLNGCCYGGVACPDCPAVTFPLSSEPRHELVARGLQTAAGFTFADLGPKDDTVVGLVEPGSRAEAAGLLSGDVVVAVNGQDVGSDEDVGFAFLVAWPRGKNDLTLTVRRGGEEVSVGPFRPRTLGLHPTQVYESISTGLLLLLLLTYYPFRRHAGEVFALFLMLYPVHRFFNEMLRDDNKPVAFGLTLSQNVSLFVFLVGLALMAWLRRLPTDWPSSATAGAVHSAR